MMMAPVRLCVMSVRGKHLNRTLISLANVSQPVFGAGVKTANELPGFESQLGAIVRYDRWLEILVEHATVFPPLVTVFHGGQVPVPSDPGKQLVITPEKTSSDHTFPGT